MPWQYVDDPAEYGLSPEEIREAAYWVDAHGTAHRGHEAAVEVLREIGGAWRRVGDALGLPGIRRLAAAAYGVISRNRHRLPGGTPACRIPSRRA